jgi:outer membrane protein assembly factor BamB
MGERGVGVNASRRDWRLVAAGVAAVLLALIVVGRLQGRNLVAGDAGPSRATTGTVRTDDRPVASGLAVAGRVALLGQAVAVAVGEGAVWVLLEQGTLLRVDPDRHRVTGRVELGATGQGGRAGPLAVGAGAVWVGTREGTVTARIDPVRLRVTARFSGFTVAVAHGVLWSYCCLRGDKMMGFGRTDARTLRPRPPLLVTDASGRRQPVGWLAVGTDAVWTTLEGQRVWRVPLAGGPARAMQVSGFPYGLAADKGAVWVLSGTGHPGNQPDRTGRLQRLDQRTGAVTATTPLPDLDVGGVNGAAGLAVGDGAVWVAGPYSRGLHAGGILLRVDPASGRVAGWLRDPLWFFHDVVAAGPRGVWVATAAPELLQVVAA